MHPYRSAAARTAGCPRCHVALERLPALAARDLSAMSCPRCHGVWLAGLDEARLREANHRWVAETQALDVGDVPVQRGATAPRIDCPLCLRSELDGKWLSVQMIGPKENRTAEHKGFDPVARRWVHVAVGNDDSWVSMSSPGWTGSTMVWTPDAAGEKYHATFTKLGEDRYSHLVTADTEHGEERVCEKVCTRVRS